MPSTKELREAIASGDLEAAQMAVTMLEADLDRPQRDLATITFQPEAHDTAADFFERIRVGQYCIEVVPTKDAAEASEPFTATLMELQVGDEDGQWKARFAPWDVDGVGPTNKKLNWVTLDLYEEIERIEVV